MRVHRVMTVLALAMLAAPLAAQLPPADATILTAAKAQAADVVDSFHRALEKGDLDTASGLISSDALIYESGGVERSKAEYASHHLPADAAFASATKRTVTRRSDHASGDIGWVATESTTTGTYKGRTINSVSTETMVLRRENGAWRIAHIHWSSANVK